MGKTSEYLEITAAKDGGDGKHKVAGLAYGGGKMRLFGWSKPVVVDLSGMTIPESVPLLANHENHTLGRVGVVNAKAENGHLAIAGEIVAEGELAEAIVAQGKAGADWQLSIGAEVEAAELVQEGKRKVNGTEHEAPFYHVTKSTLREVSVVAVGADRSTHMTVTAQLQLKGNSIMEPEVTNKETKPVEAASPATPTATPAAVPTDPPKTVTASAPKLRIISGMIAGLRKAALLVETLFAPALRTASADLQSEMPPPTVKGTVQASATRRTTSRSVPRFSTVAVMSSKASSSAPALQ